MKVDFISYILQTHDFLQSPKNGGENFFLRGFLISLLSSFKLVWGSVWVLPTTTWPFPHLLTAYRLRKNSEISSEKPAINKEKIEYIKLFSTGEMYLNTPWNQSQSQGIYLHWDWFQGVFKYISPVFQDSHPLQIKNIPGFKSAIICPVFINLSTVVQIYTYLRCECFWKH